MRTLVEFTNEACPVQSNWHARQFGAVWDARRCKHVMNDSLQSSTLGAFILDATPSRAPVNLTHLHPFGDPAVGAAFTGPFVTAPGGAIYGVALAAIQRVEGQSADREARILALEEELAPLMEPAGKLSLDKN